MRSVRHILSFAEKAVQRASDSVDEMPPSIKVFLGEVDPNYKGLYMRSRMMDCRKTFTEEEPENTPIPSPWEGGIDFGDCIPPVFKEQAEQEH